MNASKYLKRRGVNLYIAMGKTEIEKKIVMRRGGSININGARPPT